VKPVRPSKGGLVIAAILLLAGSAAAQDSDQAPAKSYRIFGQLTSVVEFNQPDALADYTKIKQLASFNVEWKRFTVGAQLEYLWWSDRDAVDPLDLDHLRSGFEPRKYYLDYQSDLFSGRLGTFFASFGRGLTLFVQKNEVLDFDEPVHGATGRLTTKHVDLTVLGGRVTEPGNDFEDEVYGGLIRFRLPADTYVGGSAVRAELERNFPAGNDEVEIWSVEAGGNGIGGVLDLAAEVSEIEKTEPTRVINGYGRYYSAVAYVGPVSILAEYKDYYNFAYRYNQPPNAGSANERYEHNDVKGPRLLVSADIFATGTLLNASIANFDTHRTPSSVGGTEGDKHLEWYAGIEQTIGRIYFEGSYFDRDWKTREISERHTVADLHVRIGRNGEIIGGVDQRLEKATYFTLDTTRTTLAYTRSPWGTASLRYSWEHRSGFEKDAFWGVEIQYLPTPQLVLTLFGGGDPGGLVCAGGQCRQEPRFEGYKANVTWRF
jgi:hypothetical protein